jgi:dipeptidyl aminopeptidase/acylaminoacyl peptidase
MERVKISIWIGCLALGSAAQAAEPLHDVTIDDYFSLASVPQFAVSPDGVCVVYCDARWQASTDDRQTDLWIVSTGNVPQPRRLTFDRANDRDPRWSADGKSIYFLGNRKRGAETKPPYDGTTQVWQLPVEGGEPRAVTRVEQGVAGYDLAQHDQLFYSVDKDASDDDEFAKQRARYPGLEYGAGKHKVSEIWRLDLLTWRAEKIVSEQRYVREFAVTSDGQRVAMVSAANDSVLKSEGESRVDVWEAGKIVTPPTDPYRGKAASPHAWLESLAWSADGQQFAFCAIFDAYPAEIVLCRLLSGNWQTELLKRPPSVHVRGYGSPLKWHPAGQVFFLAEINGRTTVAPGDFGVLESLPQQAGSNRVAYGFDFDRTGNAGVFAFGSADRFVDLYWSEWQPGASLRQLTNLNPQTTSWKLPKVSHIMWKGAGGANVGGVLELPPQYQPGTRLPLVIGIHGGPTTSVRAAAEFDPYLGRVWLPARGYAVLCPNYRGSTGYGDRFTTELIGRENEIDVADIVAGVQFLVAQGVADAAAVGVMGWSNGGYLTNCLLTRRELPFTLRAASSGAGILETAMEWGINDEPAYPKVFKGGLPWESPQAYQAASPLYALGRVTTPTLIHVGANDVRCPPAHSHMLYRALKEYVHVPTELVIYPGEPHGLGKYASRKAKMELDLAWFDKYLKPAQ